MSGGALKMSGTEQSAQRIYFIDNLRVFLTLLVVAHHSMITYAGVGSWYYNEGRQDAAATIVGGMFAGVNQAFFMALFFMISAYFTVPSLRKKGAAKFLKDRFIRLGIPIIVYDVFINPAINFVLETKLHGLRASAFEFWFNYLKHYNSIATGPLWFVSALLLFSVVYVAVAAIFGKRSASKPVPLPRTGSLIAFCLVCGALAFAVRLWMPVGKEFEIVNYQAAYFVLYIALFAAGIAAYRGDWFRSISERNGKRWFIVAHLFIIMMPVIMILGGGLEGKQDYFTGGLHYQALAYAMWEPFLCVGMCAGLTVLFRKHFNRTSALQSFLSKHAYGVYIFHPPVIVFIALAMRPLMLHPLLKFAMLITVSIPVCYAVAFAARKMPMADRVL